MTIKKYLFLTAALGLLAIVQGFAQTNLIGGHDYLDTSFVRPALQDQQASFLNHETPYPAKPRDMWEIGIHGGYNQILGERVFVNKFGYGAGISVRKALGYTISLRGELGYNQAKGTAYTSVGANRLPSSAASAYGSGAIYYPDYRTTSYTGSLDVLVSLNNILFHKEQPKTQWYVLGGYTGLVYKSELNALDGSSAYNYSSVTSGSRSDVKKQVENIHDGSYETLARGRQHFSGDYSFKNGIDAGAGVAFKVTPHFNIGLEQKFILPFADGFNALSGGFQSDLVSYTSVRLNFNVGNSSKRVEPLYWQNPLSYVYNELSNPRHLKLDVPELPDADGDGVTDQFDQCPNTPSGVPVDVHGCPLDSDGDGVPDYKDKELITPTYCQPVDADGVGKCPCPDDCGPAEVVCDLGTLPSISFTGNRVTLTDDAKSLLANVANQMRQSPSCQVVVVGHAESSKSSEQLAWDRVNAVINHMTDVEGIPASRFIFQYHGTPGDTHTVDLRSASAGEQGPNMVPPPHPNLRRSK